MKWIINYLKQCFCKHEFRFEERQSKRATWYGEREGLRVSRTCEKCGDHKSYWKF